MPDRVTLRFARMEAGAAMRHPAALFWTFAYPVILFFLLNTIFGGGGAPSGGWLTYADWLITGLAVMTMISTALFGFTAALVEQRAQGRLSAIGLSPCPPHRFFVGYTIARVAIFAGFAVVFVGGFSHLMPGATPVAAGALGTLVVWLCAGAVLLYGLALLLACLIRQPGAAYAVANLVNIPVIFLSDLFLPVAILPEGMQETARLSPVYAYVAEARAIYGGAHDPATVWTAAAAMAATGVLLLALGARAFTWTPPRVA